MSRRGLEALTKGQESVVEFAADIKRLRVEQRDLDMQVFEARRRHAGWPCPTPCL